MANGRGNRWALVLALLGVLVVIGCGGGLNDKMRGDEIAQNALAAQAGISSSHMEANLVATVQGTLYGAPLSVSVDGGKASIDADWAHKKAKADAELTVAYNGMLIPIKAGLYSVDNSSYTQATIGGMTENWTKGYLPLDVWPYLTDARVMSGLLRYVSSELAGNEDVNGVACNVLRLTPDFAAIQQALSEKYPSVGDIPDIAALFSQLSIRVWVASETSFVTRLEVSATARVTAQALGQAPNNDVLDISLTLTVEASGFNEPVSIEPPAVAQSTP